MTAPTSAPDRRHRRHVKDLRTGWLWKLDGDPRVAGPAYCDGKPASKPTSTTITTTGAAPPLNVPALNVPALNVPALNVPALNVPALNVPAQLAHRAGVAA